MAIGDVFFQAQAAVTADRKICDGSAISRTTYSDLNTLLAAEGYPYGNGDGSTTFNIPDGRSRSPMGVGQGSGLSAVTAGQLLGAESVTLFTGNLPAHDHTVNCYNGTGSSNTPSGTLPAQGQVTGSPPRTTPINQMYSTSPADAEMKAGMIANTGQNQPHANIHPCIGLHMVIQVL